MAFANILGGMCIPIGPSILGMGAATPGVSTITLDAANESLICIGNVVTSDGASHTIDTTGSSSIGWRSGSVTFSNGSSTVKVGLAAVLTSAGPPARAAHASDVISFDVAASFTGGGGGITADAWQTSVPTTGSKTIANGDLVAMAVQMTARGGADAINVTMASATSLHLPTLTTFAAAAYSQVVGGPNAIITFSDGALGYFFGSVVTSAFSTRTWNSGSTTKEYGQLYQLPFPVKVHGFYGWVDLDGDCDWVLYSDPLGTPVAEKTVSTDANVRGTTSGAKMLVMFPAPYSAQANQPLGAVFKPSTVTNMSVIYRTLADAGHRVVDPWGTSGYGISRASGAFADANSSLDHYPIGLIVSAFDHPARPTYQLGIL